MGIVMQLSASMMCTVANMMLVVGREEALRENLQVKNGGSSGNKKFLDD